MFDAAYRSKVKNFGVYVEDKGPVVFRRITMTLEREFDSEVAFGLGDAAVSARGLLKDQDMKSCVLPIDNVSGKAVLRGIDASVTIPECRGVKVAGKAGKVHEDEGYVDPPTITAEFDFSFSDDVLLFLGKNAGGYVDITLTKNQLEMAFPAPTPAMREAAELIAEAEKFIPRAANDQPAADIAEEQLADTPEEAERMREARLGRNPAADGPTEGPDGKLAW